MKKLPKRRGKSAEIAVSEFDGLFLTSMYIAFVKRGRAIGRHGTIRYEFDDERTISWFTFRCSPAGRASVLLTIDAGQRATLVIRSRHGSNILAKGGIRLVDNAGAVVKTFEDTLERVYFTTEDVIEAGLREDILRSWNLYRCGSVGIDSLRGG